MGWGKSPPDPFSKFADDGRGRLTETFIFSFRVVDFPSVIGDALRLSRGF